MVQRPREDLLDTNYEIWKAPLGVVYYLPYSYKKVYPVENWDSRFVHTSFVYYWHYSFYIVAFYVLAIHWLQRWMRPRKPYNLKWFLVGWNAALAVFSAVGSWRFGEEFLYVYNNRSFRDSVCLSIDPSGPAAFWGTLFALSKVAELMDSVFIVLRKRPLIFLHWYHHAVVLVYSWHGGNEVTAAGRWFMTMNYCVHTLMYSYYAISTAGMRFPRPISMLVTTLQTTQMLVGVGISIYVATLKYRLGPSLICQQSNANLALCFGIYVTFAILFIKFFISAYVTKTRKKAVAGSESSPSHSSTKQNGYVRNGYHSHQNGSLVDKKTD